MQIGTSKSQTSVMTHLQFTTRERIRKAYFNTPKPGVFKVWDTFFEKENSNLTKLEVHEIEKMTRGQWTNPAWHDIRDGVITSTKIKRIAKGVDHEVKNRWNMDYDYTNFRAIAEEKETGPVSRPMQWERDNMDRALDQYWEDFCEKPESHHLCRPGLVMSTKNPMIGVSPDAIVKPKNKQDGSATVLVKVKCPYTNRNKDPKVAASTVMSQWPNGKLYLKLESDLSYQIQYQLGVLKIQECDLVVYTNKGIHVETIEFDEAFHHGLMDRVYRCFSKHELWSGLFFDSTRDLPRG